MSSIPEEDVQTTSSVARNVFPAKVAEDIPAASMDDNQKEEDHLVTLTTETVVIPEVNLPDPPSNRRLSCSHCHYD